MNWQPTIRRHRPRAGLTLIELLVAVSILCIMLVAFGKIISESRKVVSVSQATLRANNAASSLEQAFREDIRRATQNGFLCISTRGGNPALYCATAGPVGSMTDAASPAQMRSNGKIVAYALNGSTLLRGGWLLRPEGGTFDSSKDFLWGQDVADIQMAGKPAIHQSFVTSLDTGANGILDNVTWPPVNDADLKNSWKYLAGNISQLSIMWTDGTPRYDGDGTNNGTNHRVGLNWYGIGRDSSDATKLAISPQDKTNGVGNWIGRTVDKLTSGQFEYDAGGYHALWTKDDPSKWPLAVKISFNITDPGMPDQVKTGGIPFEIVVPIGR